MNREERYGRNTGRRVRNYNRDSLARKFSEEEEKRQKRHEKVVKNSRKNAREDEQAAGSINAGIDLFSALVLGLGLLCILYFGVQYLNVSSNISQMKSVVSDLNSDLNDMTRENNEAYSAIDASVDFAHVYDVAVEELGMVFPEDNQIVDYVYQEEGYVRQYQTISSK